MVRLWSIVGIGALAGACLIAAALVWMRGDESSADAATSGPKWSQVQGGVVRVTGNWAVETYSSPGSDSCDRGASYVAVQWAEERYLREVGKFVLVHMSKQAIVQLVSKIWPLSWAADLLRDQIVHWLLNLAEDRFMESADGREGQKTLRAEVINRRSGAGLPNDLKVSDYFLVLYDRDARRVAITVVSDCGGPGSPLGPKPRMWEAKYEVTEDGLPKDLAQSFTRVDLAAISPSVPNLDVHLGASPDPVLLGGNLTYVVTVHNHGGLVARDIDILAGMDLFTEHVEFNSADASQGTCQVEPRAVGCDLGDLPPAGEAVVEINGTVLETAENFLKGHVWVDPDDRIYEADEADNYAEVRVRVRRTSNAPDLAIAKVGTPLEGEGDGLGEMAYALTIENRGDVAAVNVQVRDVLPGGMWLSGAPTASQGSCSGYARRVDCEVGSIAPGGNVRVEIIASVEACIGSLANTATVDPTDAIAEIDEDNNIAQDATAADAFCPTPTVWAPWPMFRRDAQRTGSSPYTGPQEPNLKWTFPSEGEWPGFSYPVVGEDGTVYVGSGYGLYAVNQQGETLWFNGDARGIPILAPDGKIYVLPGVAPYSLLVLKPDGTLEGEYELGGYPQYGEPVIDGLGRLYYVADCTVPSGDVHFSLVRLDPQGSTSWVYDIHDGRTYTGAACGPADSNSDHEIASAPALDVTGNVYFVYGPSVIAIDSDGSERWRLDLEQPCSRASCYISISPTGLIYAVVRGRMGEYPDYFEWANVYALTAEGFVTWWYQDERRTVWWAVPPAVGPDGSLYLVRAHYSWGDTKFTLVALASDGTLRWSDVVSSSSGNLSPPVVGGDGTIYISGGPLRAYAPDGTVKWSVSVSSRSGLAIGPDGTLYVAGDKLRAFGPGLGP